jgi:hypothetical protein
MTTTAATTVGRLVERATSQLLDPGNVRWTRAVLVDLINEAMREILAHRPDAFASTIELPLQAGAMQRLDSRYSSLASVETCAGARVHEGDYKYYRLQKSPTLVARRGSNPAKGFTVRTYVKHPIDDRIFYVEPPVPPDAKLSVTATVIQTPGHLSAGDVDTVVPIRPEFEAQVLDWVCYRCLASDHESNEAREQSKVHLDAFLKLMGLKDRAALRYHNGMFDPTDREQKMQHPGKGTQ